METFVLSTYLIPRFEDSATWRAFEETIQLETTDVIIARIVDPSGVDGWKGGDLSHHLLASLPRLNSRR
jgi:hypothetical protein